MAQKPITADQVKDEKAAIPPVESLAGLNEEKEPATDRAKQKIRRFKLLVGAHVHGKDENGKPKMYVAGKNDVIETTVDLLKMNSRKPGHEMQKKFVEIYDDGSMDFYGGTRAVPVNPFEQRKNESAAEFHSRMLEMSKAATEAAEKAMNRDEKLAKMTVAQLREYAESEEIDLKGTTNKDEILKLLRGK